MLSPPRPMIEPASYNDLPASSTLATVFKTQLQKYPNLHVTYKTNKLVEVHY